MFVLRLNRRTMRTFAGTRHVLRAASTLTGTQFNRAAQFNSTSRFTTQNFQRFSTSSEVEAITFNSVVLMNYTLKNETGDVLDTSLQEGREPFAWLSGHGNIVPGLEKVLQGKKVGDKVDAVVPAEEAYGPVDPSLIQQVPRKNFQDPNAVQVGARFQLKQDETSHPMVHNRVVV